MTEADEREASIRGLFKSNQLDNSKHTIDGNKARMRWLYHWFGFEKDDEVLKHPALRTGGDCIDIDLTYSTDVNEIRENWAVMLREFLWNNPCFRPFTDSEGAFGILQSQFGDASETSDVKCILRLSSMMPGTITATWAASETEMVQSRFYLDVNGNFWANVGGVAAKVPLKDIVGKHPYRKMETDSIPTAHDELFGLLKEVILDDNWEFLGATSIVYSLQSYIRDNDGVPIAEMLDKLKLLCQRHNRPG